MANQENEMNTHDTIEFYDSEANGHRALVATVKSSIVPTAGSLVSIRGQRWTVDHVTYSIDYADDAPVKAMRANVTMTRARRA